MDPALQADTWAVDLSKEGKREKVTSPTTVTGSTSYLPVVSSSTYRKGIWRLRCSGSPWVNVGVAKADDTFDERKMFHEGRWGLLLSSRNIYANGERQAGARTAGPDEFPVPFDVTLRVDVLRGSLSATVGDVELEDFITNLPKFETMRLAVGTYDKTNVVELLGSANLETEEDTRQLESGRDLAAERRRLEEEALEAERARQEEERRRRQLQIDEEFEREQREAELLWQQGKQKKGKEKEKKAAQGETQDADSDVKQELADVKEQLAAAVRELETMKSAQQPPPQEESSCSLQ